MVTKWPILYPDCICQVRQRLFSLAVWHQASDGGRYRARPADIYDHRDSLRRDDVVGEVDHGGTEAIVAWYTWRWKASNDGIVNCKLVLVSKSLFNHRLC